MQSLCIGVETQPSPVAIARFVFVDAHVSEADLMTVGVESLDAPSATARGVPNHDALDGNAVRLIVTAPKIHASSPLALRRRRAHLLQASIESA
jgi:hypothetical protein